MDQQISLEAAVEQVHVDMQLLRQEIRQSETAASSIPMDPQEKLAALRCSLAYAKAVEAYSNKFVNGAGMQRPGTRGFELWLIYSAHTKLNGNPPTLREAIDLAKEYGLNTTSAANALGKWSAFYGFRPPRTGEYAMGPRSHLLDPVPIQKIPESGLSSISTKRTEMSIIKVPAAIVRQGDLTLFTTSIKVRDLIVPGFYSVETLDPDNANDSGYQRLLNTARAKRLADYVVEGQDTKDAFLPTAMPVNLLCKVLKPTMSLMASMASAGSTTRK